MSGQHGLIAQKPSDRPAVTGPTSEGGNSTSPPEPAARPLLQAVLVEDVTTEALVTRLADVPRGLLLGVDELVGWVRSMDRYRGGRGGDLAKYLAMHGGRPAKTDRKGGDRPTIYVLRAALSVVGTIQTRTLARVLDDEPLAAGLGARLFFARPPVKAPRWNESDVPEGVLARYGETIKALLSLALDQADEPSASVMNVHPSLVASGAPARMVRHESAARLRTGRRNLGPSRGRAPARPWRCEGAPARL